MPPEDHHDAADEEGHKQKKAEPTLIQPGSTLVEAEDNTDRTPPAPHPVEVPKGDLHTSTWTTTHQHEPRHVTMDLDTSDNAANTDISRADIDTGSLKETRSSRIHTAEVLLATIMTSTQNL